MVIEEVAESSFRNLLIIVDGESRIESIFLCYWKMVMDQKYQKHLI